MGNHISKDFYLSDPYATHFRPGVPNSFQNGCHKAHKIASTKHITQAILCIKAYEVDVKGSSVQCTHIIRVIHNIRQPQNRSTKFFLVAVAMVMVINSVIGVI